MEDFLQHDRPAWAALARSVLLRARRGRRPDRRARRRDRGQRPCSRPVRLPHPGRARRSSPPSCGSGSATPTAPASLLVVARPVSAGPPGLDEVAALRRRALVAEAAVADRAPAGAVNRGVRILDDHHAVLGAIELRALAAAYSNGLARIGVRLAIDDHRPRSCSPTWRRTRRTVSLLPAARPPDDEVLADLLTELRVVPPSSARPSRAGAPTESSSGERAALEAAHPRSPAAGTGGRRTSRSSHSTSRLHLLGDRALVEYANLDGRLYAVSVVGGRASIHDLGPIDGLLPDIDWCSHALHRLNRAQGSAGSRQRPRATSLGVLTGALAERLIPPAVCSRSQRPVVVVPTGMLHGLPWGALPGFAGGPCRCARR